MGRIHSHEAELARLFGLDAKAATLHYTHQGVNQNYVTSGFDAVADDWIIQ